MINFLKTMLFLLIFSSTSYSQRLFISREYLNTTKISQVTYEIVKVTDLESKVVYKYLTITHNSKTSKLEIEEALFFHKAIKYMLADTLTPTKNHELILKINDKDFLQFVRVRRMYDPEWSYILYVETFINSYPKKLKYKDLMKMDELFSKILY